MLTHWNTIARVRKELDWIHDRLILVLIFFWIWMPKDLWLLGLASKKSSLVLKRKDTHGNVKYFTLLFLSRNGVLSRGCRSDPTSCPATQFPTYITSFGATAIPRLRFEAAFGGCRDLVMEWRGCLNPEVFTGCTNTGANQGERQESTECVFWQQDHLMVA